jgi:predicted ArsR family transcriptional regulator
VPPPPREWNFLTNHGHVLVVLALDADARVRDVAERVGITTRAAQSILNDLQDGGYVRAERVGRRNRYTIVHRSHLRHPLEAHVVLADFLGAIVSRRPGRRPAQAGGVQ